MATTLTANSAQVQSILTGITDILAYYNSGNQSLLNSVQLSAFQNTQALLNPYASAGITNYLLNNTQITDFNNITYIINNLGNIGLVLTFSQSQAAAGSLTQIQNANTATANANNAFPFGANTVVYNDTYFICEQPGTNQFYISEPGNGFFWNPLAVTTFESEGADTVLAMDILQGGVVAFGTQSIEFYADQGVAVSGVPGTTPYEAYSGYTQNWGLTAIYSRAQFQGGLTFLGQNIQGTAQIMWIGPGQVTPTPISNPDIDHLISETTYPQAALAQSYYVDGHPMYEITFPLDSLSLLYDGSSQVWSVLQSGVGLFGRHMTNFACNFAFQNFVSDQATGNIYLLDVNNFTDNGNPIKRQLRTKHITDNGKMFAISEIWLTMDTGDAPQAPAQGSSPLMMCSVSTDYGATYDNERYFDMGSAGQYYKRVGDTCFGMARDFVFQFTVTDPVPFIVSAAYGTMIPGTERD